MPHRLPILPLLAAAASAVLLAPEAAPAVTHVISPWTVPMTAVTIDAEVGDALSWTVGPGHTVDYLPPLDGQDLDPVTDSATICASIAGTVRIDAGGIASVNLTQAGTFYYVCAAAFPLHCNNGMRVRVNVTDTAVGVDGEIEPSPWGRVKARYR